MNKFLYLILFVLSQPVSILGQMNKDHKINYSIVLDAEINNFEFREGIFDHKFKMSDNTSWEMKIYFPKHAGNKNIPVILALHWAGGGNTYNDYANCLAIPALKHMDAILIIPSADGKKWIDTELEQKTIHFIRQIKHHWPIDGDKILITGFSNGGIGSWTYALNYPDLFCAAIPMAGSYTSDKIKVPTYVIHGAKDELFDKEKIIKRLQRSIQKGSNITYEILPYFTHYMACDYAESLKRKATKVKTKIWEHSDK